ncbi:MAG TPA: DUF4838 domain-containing protein [Tepidisphaeraceae bacterium]|jgi:hypothetical protein|nr:DUF4838 domain-containing protein [Tepidisphaeraceae bacterium]
MMYAIRTGGGASILNPLFLGIALALMLGINASAHAAVLVQDGHPMSAIVVDKAALQPAKNDAAAQKVAAAAHDFQDYVRKISGAQLPIVDESAHPEGIWVLIGKSPAADALHADIPAGLTPARREEGFIIRCKGDRLLLAGNDQGPYHGTEYAVSDMLERLGVRWFMPGEFGEFTPKQATIDLPDLDIRQKPDFIQRNWWLHTTPEMAAQEARWKIHNKMNPDVMFAMPGDSSSRDFVADAKLAATKPELFARNIDGSVNPYMPNLTNPEAAKIAAEKMKEKFRKDPIAGSFGIAPDDGLPRDFSPETVKHNAGFVDLLGREGVEQEKSVSEEWISFVNNMARDVKQTYPDRIITTNGYANRNLPPQGVSIEPNISVMFAAIWSDTLHAYDDPKSWQMVRQGQMLRSWCKLCDKVWIYGYDYTMMTSGLTPLPITRKLARDLPLLKKWGVVGFDDETRNQWAECGIPTKYVRARLEWNANADVDAMLDDFFGKWYGKAAVPERRFWDSIEETIERTRYLGHEDRIMPYVYTPRMMRQCSEAIDQAEKLADTDRDRLHVKVDRLIYQHLEHYMAMSAHAWAGEYTAAAQDADAMMAVRKQLQAINPFFMLDNEKPYDAGIWYWGVVARGEYYRKLADMTGGKTGDLVALLPEKAAFHIDPHDEGRFAGWEAPAFDEAAWQRIKTTQPFYTQGYLSPQGYPYTGYIWYRLKATVPASFAGKPVTFYAPAIETEGWLWVNGRYIAHRPYREAYERPNELQADITSAIKPGEENVIVLRIATGLSMAQAAGGVVDRMFLYSPKVKGN